MPENMKASRHFGLTSDKKPKKPLQKKFFAINSSLNY
jgi:hypothetical protein